MIEDVNSGFNILKIIRYDNSNKITLSILLKAFTISIIFSFLELFIFNLSLKILIMFIFCNLLFTLLQFLLEANFGSITSYLFTMIIFYLSYMLEVYFSIRYSLNLSNIFLFSNYYKKFVQYDSLIIILVLIILIVYLIKRTYQKKEYLWVLK
ncbi:MAG: hypothetical protein ACK5HS_01050 [Mycoplasmatales bacterium]